MGMGDAGACAFSHCIVIADLFGYALCDKRMRSGNSFVFVLKSRGITGFQYRTEVGGTMDIIQQE